MKTINEVRNELETRKDRSQWNKGVTIYALELLNEIAEALEWNGEGDTVPTDYQTLKHYALNGADDWSQYSWGGSSLICNYEIAERLCNPSELKKKKGGELKPNSREEWLDTQARALSQAFSRIIRIVRA